MILKVRQVLPKWRMKSGGYVKGENPYFVSFIGDAPKKNPKVIVYAGMSLAQKNDQEAYEMGVSKAFKPIMENTLKYLNVGSKKMKQNLHNIQKYQM